MPGKSRTGRWSFVVPAWPCPACGKVMDRAGPTDLKLKAPVTGDWTICLRCAAVLRFDGQMHLRMAPLPEWQAFAAEQPDEAAKMRKLQLVILSQPGWSPPSGLFGRG